MDFENMKRKELQSICKKHGIPANLSNQEMVDRLSSLFKVFLTFNCFPQFVFRFNWSDFV